MLRAGLPLLRALPRAPRLAAALLPRASNRLLCASSELMRDDMEASVEGR